MKPSTEDTFEKEFLRRDDVQRLSADKFEKEFLPREVVKRMFGERWRRHAVGVSVLSLEEVLELAVEQLKIGLLAGT